ncbi:MAG: hypothetical protein HC829_07315 [Bacteroidales bacterium]|nr:hypothetical protein [Bacteroidales bacterium]
MAEGDFGERVADRLAHHRAVRTNLDLTQRWRIDQRRLVRRAIVDGSPASIVPVVVNTRQWPTMPDDQHHGRRVRFGSGQIKRFHSAGNLGLQLEHLLDRRGQRRLVDCRGIEGDVVFELDLEGVIELAMVAELPGEMKALRILERFARVEIGPDASAKWIGLLIELPRQLVIELLFDNRREGSDALSIRQDTDSAAASLCRPQFVQTKFRQSFNEFSSKHIDAFLISQIWNVFRQLDFGLALVLSNGKDSSRKIDPGIFDQSKSIGTDRTCFAWHNTAPAD